MTAPAAPIAGDMRPAASTPPARTIAGDPAPSRVMLPRAARPFALAAADIAMFALVSALAVTLHRFLRGDLVAGETGSLAFRLELPALVMAGTIFYFAAATHYTHRIPFWNELRAVLVACAVACAAGTFLTVAVRGAAIDDCNLLFWVLAVPGLLAGRQAMRALLAAVGCWQLRTVVIGDAAAIASARAALESEPALGYAFVGSVDMQDVGDPNELGSWVDLVRARNAELVILGIGLGDPARERMVAATLTRARIDVAIMPVFAELPVFGFNEQYFFSHDVLLLMARSNVGRPFGRALKLAFDKTAAALLLLLLAPLFVVLASLVRADGGPAFFGHRRIGANGRAFRCFKFRTMVTDSDRVLRRAAGSPTPPRAPNGKRSRNCATTRGSPGWAVPPQDQPRRAAAAHQRPARRDEPGRAAPADRRARSAMGTRSTICAVVARASPACGR